MASPTHHPPSLLSLPPELLLDILSRISYTSGHLTRLRLVCRTINHLLRNYEHSLAHQITTLQFPSHCLAKFPGLHTPDTNISFALLDEISARTQTLFRLERNCHSIRRRGGKRAAWMRPEWINLQMAGLYLLYRLYDSGTPLLSPKTPFSCFADWDEKGPHASQAHLINSLPSTSLAILLLTLHLCIHQIRADGPDILTLTRPHCCALHSSLLRFEIELAAEELLLRHGPTFLDSLLCHDEDAIQTLRQEVEGMENRQLPDGDGKPRAKTLIAELRCALARGLGSGVGENSSDMWGLVGGIGALGNEGVVDVVWGRELRIAKRQDSGVGVVGG